MLNHGSAADVFRALGDPTRTALVEALARGTKSVSELAAPLGITLAAVLQHLSVMEKCELVQTEKVGRVRPCRLDPRGLNELERWISQRRAEWNRHLDKRDEHLRAEEVERKGNAQ